MGFSLFNFLFVFAGICSVAAAHQESFLRKRRATVHHHEGPQQSKEKIQRQEEDFTTEGMEFLLRRFLEGHSSMPPDVRPTSTSKQPKWNHEKGDISLDPTVVVGELSNGMRYQLRSNSVPAGKLEMRLHIDAGANMEKDDELGLAHFLEHMAFRTTKHSNFSWMPVFQRLGLGTGSHVNAYTNFHETVYRLGLPNLKNETVITAFTWFRDVADGVLFQQDEMDTERGVVLSELQDQDSVKDRLWELTIDWLIPGHLRSERDVIGTKETITSMNMTQFQGFYDNYYVPRRTVVTLVGDMPTTDMEALVVEYFDSWLDTGSRGYDQPYGNITQGLGFRSKVFVHSEVAFDELTLNSPRPYDSSAADTEERRIERMILSIGFNILARRLRALTGDPESPINWAKAGISRWYSSVEFPYITLQPKKGQWREAVGVLEQEFRRAKLYGFTKAELELQRMNRLNYFEQQILSQSTRSSKKLVNNLVSSTNGDFIVTTPQDSYDIVAPTLKNLTVYDVREVFSTYWNNSNMNLYLTTSDLSGLEEVCTPLGNETCPVVRCGEPPEGCQYKLNHSIMGANGDCCPKLCYAVDNNGNECSESDANNGTIAAEDAAIQLKELYFASELVEVKPPKDEEVLSFAYSDFGTPGSIVSDALVEDLDIRQLVLSNNIRVNLKTTAFAAEDIQIVCRFGTGKLGQPTNASMSFLDDFTDRLIELGGLGRMSSTQITNSLAGKNLRLDMNTYNGAFQMSGRTNPDDLLIQLQLLAAHFLDPGFREEGVRAWRSRAPSFKQNLQYTLKNTVDFDAWGWLRGNDERFTEPTLDELLTMEAANSKAWLLPQLQNSYLEISIVGDFNQTEAIEYLLETFGALGEREDAPVEVPESERALSVPMPPQTHEITYETKVPNAATMAVWELPSMVGANSSEDMAASRKVQLLKDIFRDRMRRYIREVIGGSYSPRAWTTQSSDFEYGFFFGYAEGEPEEMAVLNSAIMDIAVNMTETEGGRITEDEFVRVLAPVRTRVEDSFEDNGYWLNVVKQSQAKPIVLDWTRERKAFYDSVTVGELNDLAKQYLMKNQALRIFILPVNPEA